MLGKKGYNFWKKIKVVSEEVETEILNQGVLTGSLVFGGFKSDSSDIDILLPPEYSYLWADLLHTGKGWYQRREYRGEGFKTIYTKFNYYKQPVNLILMHTHESFEEWKTATTWMREIVYQEIVPKYILENKETRVELFETLKDLAKEII